MRLFLGLPFTEQAKDRFVRAQGELKKLAEKGNFTAQDNFHLTLFFLGEMDTGQADAAKAALMAAHIAPLTLTFDRLSLFPGGIYHLSPEFEPDLYAAQLRLVPALHPPCDPGAEGPPDLRRGPHRAAAAAHPRPDGLRHPVSLPSGSGGAHLYAPVPHIK